MENQKVFLVVNERNKVRAVFDELGKAKLSLRNKYRRGKVVESAQIKIEREYLPTKDGWITVEVNDATE